jgi:hypothetical protein
MVGGRRLLREFASSSEFPVGSMCWFVELAKLHVRRRADRLDLRRHGGNVHVVHLLLVVLFLDHGLDIFDHNRLFS